MKNKLKCFLIAKNNNKNKYFIEFKIQKSKKYL